MKLGLDVTPSSVVPAPAQTDRHVLVDQPVVTPISMGRAAKGRRYHGCGVDADLWRTQ